MTRTLNAYSGLLEESRKHKIVLINKIIFPLPRIGQHFSNSLSWWQTHPKLGYVNSIYDHSLSLSIEYSSVLLCLSFVWDQSLDQLTSDCMCETTPTSWGSLTWCDFMNFTWSSHFSGVQSTLPVFVAPPISLFEEIFNPQALNKQLQKKLQLWDKKKKRYCEVHQVLPYFNTWLIRLLTARLTYPLVVVILWFDFKLHINVKQGPFL